MIAGIYRWSSSCGVCVHHNTENLQSSRHTMMPCHRTHNLPTRTAPSCSLLTACNVHIAHNKVYLNALWLTAVTDFWVVTRSSYWRRPYYVLQCVRTSSVRLSRTCFWLRTKVIESSKSSCATCDARYFESIDQKRSDTNRSFKSIKTAQIWRKFSMRYA